MASLIRASRNTLNIARFMPIEFNQISTPEVSKDLIYKWFMPGTIRMMSNEWGSGAGKGGGSGGSVREAGGSFGKMEAAHEEQYFRKLQAEQLQTLNKSVEEMTEYHKQEIKHHEQLKQLESLKCSLDDMVGYHECEIKHHEQAEQLSKLHEHHEEEISNHEAEIKRHKDAINRHRSKMEKLNVQQKKGSDSD